MPGVVIAALLISSLLLVHFSVRTRPLPADRPLDEDAGLPLPEIGQASTVFSLTALFGAYLGIFLLLGAVALSGLAVGTGVGILLIRSWVRRRPWKSFEAFLAAVLGRSVQNANVTAFTLAGIQLCYAVSELLILREISSISLGLRLEHATLVAACLATIAYFYVLFGGYVAVFRTDVLQFGFVVVMAIAIAFVVPDRLVRGEWSPGGLLPRPGYWHLPTLGSSKLLHAYQFTVAALMGLGFIVASPDAWKRIFLVADRRRKDRSFAWFVSAGLVPFVFLIPVSSISGYIPDGTIDTTALWAGVLASNALFVAVALGLIASFMSAFDSAILAAVHVTLVARRRPGRPRLETSDFHWLMAGFLLSTGLLFAAALSIGNPYLIGNVLIGPYAAIAGLLVGTRGRVSLKEGRALPLLVVSQVVWFMYLASNHGFAAVPTTYQVNSVPAGSFLFVIVALVGWLVRNRESHVRRIRNHSN